MDQAGIFLLAIMVGSVSAESFSAALVEHGWGLTIDYTPEEGRSVLATSCLKKCLQKVDCTHFYHDEANGKCWTLPRNMVRAPTLEKSVQTSKYEVTGLVGTQCNPDGKCSGPDAVCTAGECTCKTGLYWSPTDNGCSTDVPVGEGCAVDGDCQGAWTVCEGGTCQCSPGMSHDARIGDCSQGCTVYGATFSVAKGCNIAGNNMKAFQPGEVTSAKECGVRCLNTSSCVSFEYHSLMQTCSLGNVTRFDVTLGDWRCGTNYDNYVLNCA